MTYLKRWIPGLLLATPLAAENTVTVDINHDTDRIELQVLATSSECQFDEFEYRIRINLQPRVEEDDFTLEGPVGWASSVEVENSPGVQRVEFKWTSDSKSAFAIFKIAYTPRESTPNDTDPGNGPIEWRNGRGSVSGWTTRCETNFLDSDMGNLPRLVLIAQHSGVPASSPEWLLGLVMSTVGVGALMLRRASSFVATKPRRGRVWGGGREAKFFSCGR